MVNEITLADADQVCSDARLLQRMVRTDEARKRTVQLFERGFQTRSGIELKLGTALAELPVTN